MFTDTGKIFNSLEHKFHGQKILVVGDIMLDRYLWGKVSRISPEAPVPVVKVHRETQTAGGAGNVALNVAGLGLQVEICGFIGSDADGAQLVQLLEESGVDTSGIIHTPRSTITKTRIIGGHQQMLRLDMETDSAIDDSDTERISNIIDSKLRDGVGVIIISDYAKGTLSEDICRAAIQAGRRYGIPVLVDPKGNDYFKYTGATALSPNRSEMAQVSHTPVTDMDSLVRAGQQLIETLDLQFLLLTLSEQGMALIDRDSVQHIPAVGREVFDVSGAGDTVIATLAAGMAAGIDLPDAVRLANMAAGVVVGKVGTIPIKRRELIQAITDEQAIDQSDKICTPESLSERIDRWHAQGERIVFTNGCFDLLHVGHVTFLERAKHQGDRLIIGLNTDHSVRLLKGASRPLIPHDERARVLAALASVDAVVLFDEDTPVELIKRLRPDVLVKGTNYREDQVAGADEVRSWGGNVVLLPVVGDHATTKILNAVAKAADIQPS